ncbi:MAG: hypothetical protein LKJ78_08150 [Serratia liquefaciens]|uniref:hypothetical protein n=1 Tax=Serratia proteamaculans TaxID=28151 RepID=UPI001EEF52AF|nr:hypothetical protein [Serratia proteamaculans]MCH4196479.1 hypothetical protein [Serratia liquefaciens]ULF51033.1 hypothetical protein LBP97_14580 [Serratia marcescens]MCH4230808.1 hypothetical protein [Serratia liquefaciens]MCH4262498.1 hypothetical protein [Serratia liquefaciens]MCI1214619.1 hypothetical protein [Serratia liquefaciens]
MEYTFSALSSNKTDRYEVVVFEVAGQIGITCECPATVLCKHKAALITGSLGSIFPTNLNDPQQLESAISVIKLSGLTEKYSALNAELDELKKEFKDQEKQIKYQLNALCRPKV